MFPKVVSVPFWSHDAGSGGHLQGTWEKVASNPSADLVQRHNSSYQDILSSVFDHVTRISEAPNTLRLDHWASPNASWEKELVVRRHDMNKWEELIGN